MPPDGAAVAAYRRLVAPLRHRGFAILWVGMTASLLGDGFLLIALAWQVYELSNVPAALSAVGVAMTLPHVAFLLVAGALSDRIDRCRIMIAADGVRAGVLLVMGALACTGTLRLWHLIPLMALYGAGTAFFGPAFDALVPDLVPPHLLVEANAIDQLVRPAAMRLAGPALAGVVIAAGGTGLAFLLDGGTFLVSMLCLFVVGTVAPARNEASREEPTVGGSSLRAALAAGFRFVRERVWLWGTFLAATCAYLLMMGPTEVLLPHVLKNDMHAGAGSLGLVFAFGGLGAVAGALVVGAHGHMRRHMTFIYVVWALATASLAGYGLARAPWQAMAVGFVLNGLESAGTVVWLTAKQRLVPQAFLGRVSSFDWFISIGLVPVSFAVTAPVAAAFGSRTTLVGAGILGGIVTIAFLFLPGMRAVEKRDARVGAEPALA